MKVDFVPNAGAASEIYMIDASGAIASGPGPAPGYGAAPAYGAAPGYGGGYAPGMAPTVAYTGEDLGLWDYFKKVMGKSFNGEGRARRKEYWSFVLFTWLIFVVLMILMMVIAGGAISAAMSSSSYYGYGYSDGGFGALIGALGVWFFVYIVIALVFLPASITVMIRRPARHRHVGLVLPAGLRALYRRHLPAGLRLHSLAGLRQQVRTDPEAGADRLRCLIHRT